MKRFCKLSSVPIVLVGNKCDLMNDREVSTDEGRKLADRMKAVFLETSAKNNQVSPAIPLSRNLHFRDLGCT